MSHWFAHGLQRNGIPYTHSFIAASSKDIFAVGAENNGPNAGLNLQSLSNGCSISRISDSR
jgi:hypothetical protein